MHKLILCGREGHAGEEEEEEEEEDAGLAEDAEAAEGVHSAVVEAAQVEWEEEDAGVVTAGLRFLAEAIVAAEAIAAAGATGPRRGPVAWLRTGTRPEETSTGRRSPRRFNHGRMAPDQLFLRLLKEEGVGPARPATKGFPMWVEEGAPVNSPGEVKVLVNSPGEVKVLVNSRGEVKVLVNSRGEVKVLVNLREEVKVLRVADSKVLRGVRFPTECRAANWARWQEAR